MMKLFGLIVALLFATTAGAATQTTFTGPFSQTYSVTTTGTTSCLWPQADALNCVLSAPLQQNAAILLGPLTSGSSQGTPPSSPILQVATNTQFGNTLSAFTQGMCRVAHYTRAGITTSQAIYPGWYVNPINTGNYGIEKSTGNYTVSRWIEYPNGTYTQVDNGITVTGGTNTAGGVGNVAIPANTQFYEWYFLSGGTWPYLNLGYTALSSALSEACNMGATASPSTPGPSITDNGSFLRWAGPVAIIGPNSKGVAVLLTGDSKTIGVHDAADTSTNRGNLARSVGPSYDYINAAVSGADSSEYLSGGVNQKLLKQYVTHVVNEYGINFFFNRNMSNAGAWPFEARMQAVFNGLRYVGTNLTPTTSSTDNWVTVANQTLTLTQHQGWNTNRQAQTPFVDLATPVTSPTANKWLVSPSPPYTADGLHENVAGYAQIATSASSIITAINAAPVVVVTQPSVSLTGGGVLTYDTTTPKFGSGSLKTGWGYNTGSFPGTIPATMECWYKAPANPGGFYLFGQGNDGTGTFPSPAVIVSGSTLEYRYTGGPTATSNTVADGTWHHLAFVMQPGSFQLYDNGVQAASGSISLSQAPLPVSGFEVKFNGNPTSPSITNGELDECAVWNIAKYTTNFTPPTEAYNGNEAGLMMLYHFDSNMVGYSPWYGQNAPGTPIVDVNSACTVAVPLSPGGAVCSFTANNTPTSWTLVGTSPTCASCFALSNSGVVTGGSGSANVLAGTYTLTVNATNGAGTSANQAQSVVATGGALPPGVTLQAIDGESMSDAVTMTHTFYTRNSFTRVTAGTFNPSWDNPAFYPILTFYTDSTNLPLAVALGYNTSIDTFSSPVWANFDTYKIWQFSAFPGQGGPPNPASDFVSGTYTDEPQNLNTDNSGGSPLYLNNSVAGTTIASGPVLIAQTSNSAANGVFGSDGSGPPMQNTTNPATAWVTANPGSQHRGVDMTNMDFYWFADSTASGRPTECARMIYQASGGPDCTTSQMARCSGYGYNVSQMRKEYFGNGAEPETVPATTPLGIYVEEGNGNQTNGARDITAGELICAAWDSIIHGARFLSYFYWPDVSGLSPGAPIYDAVKATNALITAQASMLNAPFAKSYVTVSLSDGNANSYIFPNINFDPTTGWFGQGLEVAAKWYSSKFYILATTKYAESGYTTKTATFTLAGGAGTTATVIYSSDSASPSPIAITSGHFSDTFPHPWSVRIYRID